MKKFLGLVAAVGLVAVPLCMDAQQSSSPGSDRKITVDALVTDKSGKAVAGLQPGDFGVLDDGQPVKVLSFAARSVEQPPPNGGAWAQIFIIVDEVNAPFEKVTYARDGVKKFLTANGGRLAYPVSLGFFTDKGLDLQTQPSADGNALAAALDQQLQGLRAEIKGTGFYGDEQRLKLSMDAMDQLIAKENGQPGRKMVIWVSPGWPLLSGARVQLSEGQQQHIMQSVTRLSTGLRIDRITLYSVDPLGSEGVGTVRTTYYQNFTKGLTKPKDADLADLSLQVLATQTGGRVIFGNDFIQNSLAHDEAELNAFYTFVIESKAGDRADQFHGLKITVDKPELAVRARNGYYAQP